jgi:LPXTG-motif cell wall-anchored protein
MNRSISLALLVVGIVLLVWGFNASESAASELSEAVSGAPTDRSIWLIVLGILAACVGGFGLLRRRA